MASSNIGDIERVLSPWNSYFSVAAMLIVLDQGNCDMDTKPTGHYGCVCERASGSAVVLFAITIGATSGV